ncbi:hypothetical protein [Desulfobacter sp.]
MNEETIHTLLPQIRFDTSRVDTLTGFADGPVVNMRTKYLQVYPV